MSLTFKLKTMKYKFTDKFSMMTRRQKRIFKFQCFVIAYVIITSGIGTVAILDYSQARYSYYRNVYELGTAYAKGKTDRIVIKEVPVIRTEDATKAVVDAATQGAIQGTNAAIKDNLGKR